MSVLKLDNLRSKTVDLFIEEQLVAALGEQAARWYPSLFAAQPIRIWASVEDVMKLGRLERGEVAEARLAVKLMEMGVIVAKPMGKAGKWDLLAEAGGKLSRLQVKSAWVKTAWASRKPAYVIATGPTDGGKSGYFKRWYTPKEIDFVIGYVAPEDAWFVFPVRLLRTTGLVIRTDPKWRYARYRERWDLLYPKGKRPATKAQ